MSKQTIADAFIPVEREYKARVMEETWGHLAPKKNRIYKGTIIFAYGEYGDMVPLHAEFAGLDDSPWFFDALSDFISDFCLQQEKWGVFRFTGTFRNYKFKGQIEQVHVDNGTSNSNHN